MILEPNEIHFDNKMLAMVLFAQPGVGKTTLALSAPDPVLIDFDNGLFRVNRRYWKPTEPAKSYDDVLATIAALPPGKYKTVVIDTVGSMIESMKPWAKKTEPGANKKNSSGITQQGYGVIKSEYLRLSDELRRSYNVIFVFHADKTKGKDQEIYYDLICEGATKTTVWQPSDLGAFMFMQNGRRYLDFSPTEEHSAKSGHGVKGILEVPELKDGDPNTFLTDLFAKIRENIAADDAAGAEERNRYEAIMAAGIEQIKGVQTIEDMKRVGANIKAMGGALTSTAELRQRLQDRMTEVNIIYDKAKKDWVQLKPPEPEPVPAAPAADPTDVPGGGLL